MTGRLIVRGLLLGLLAGLLAFGLARVAGEPLVDKAIAFETALDQAKGEAAEPELVSRATQASWGLLTATLATGAASGGLFAVVFALVYGRFGRLGPRATSAMLALAGFVALAVVPALKYPANPPSIGDPETIGMRTALFFELIAVGLAGIAVAVALARSLAARWGLWNANLAGAALFVVLVGFAVALMPAINEVPEGFSATLLWRFRLVSMGLQAMIWTVLGLGFGPLAKQVLARREMRGLRGVAEVR